MSSKKAEDITRIESMKSHQKLALIAIIFKKVIET
jgi:hypothetical protein